jgi:hypothetical protein
MRIQRYAYGVGACVAVVFLGYAYYRLYWDKPSYRYLGYDDSVMIANRRTHEQVVDISPVDGSGVRGTLTVQEVNEAVVVIFRMTAPITQAVTPVRIFAGTCEALGEKRYTLPPLKAGNTVGWTPIYGVDWNRLVSELPLSFVIQSENGSSAIACADIRLRQTP